jgi:uncharacterized membrane protein YraQ (UPF0718 family)
MNWKGEWRKLAFIIAIFLACFYLPIGNPRFNGAILEAFLLIKWYAREHVLLCLVPAFFIAGAIGVFVSQASVMRYFGARANKVLAYGVASVSGTVLAVCSCTVLPLFGSIYMRGAGLGPAIAFLYSGPAINVLAIVLTARVLGWQLGLARAVGAVAFSVIIGLLMHLIFLKEERARTANQDVYIEEDAAGSRPLWQVAVYFLAMIGILVFANWAKPQQSTGLWSTVFAWKWKITAVFAILLAFGLWRFFKVRVLYLVLAAITVAVIGLAAPRYPIAAFAAGSAALAVLTFFGGAELKEWRGQTWGFAKLILPLLLGGVLAAGFFLGSPTSTDAGIIPNNWVQALVGDSPNALLQILGRPDGFHVGWLDAVWPIFRGLLDNGMGQGPALALLLAGPALSLPSMLVLNSMIGPKKTFTYVSLVVVMATITGMIFGAIV